jgi:hypothetical protein
MMKFKGRKHRLTLSSPFSLQNKWLPKDPPTPLSKSTYPLQSTCLTVTVQPTGTFNFTLTPQNLLCKSLATPGPIAAAKSLKSKVNIEPSSLKFEATVLALQPEPPGARSADGWMGPPFWERDEERPLEREDVRVVFVLVV